MRTECNECRLVGRLEGWVLNPEGEALRSGVASSWEKSNRRGLLGVVGAQFAGVTKIPDEDASARENSQLGGMLKASSDLRTQYSNRSAVAWL
jgi:hypothetical protein